MISFKPDFELSVDAGGDPSSRVIVARGELDSGTSEDLLAVVGELLSGELPQRLLLDLRELSFIDSTGMRAMIMVEREARARGIEIDTLSPSVEVLELLQIAGVAERIALAPDSPELFGDAEFYERIDVDLTKDRFAPGIARAEIRAALSRTDEEFAVSQAALLTSELVTNAVLHSGAAAEPIGLRIAKYPEGIRVEVNDPGPGFDLRAPRESRPEGGRGLMIVDQCAARWGTRRLATARGQRFCVWFELDREDV